MTAVSLVTFTLRVVIAFATYNKRFARCYQDLLLFLLLSFLSSVFIVRFSLTPFSFLPFFVHDTRFYYYYRAFLYICHLMSITLECSLLAHKYYGIKNSLAKCQGTETMLKEAKFLIGNATKNSQFICYKKHIALKPHFLQE